MLVVTTWAADREWGGITGRRRLVVALVGAIGLSMVISPADALTSGSTGQGATVARLVVRPCLPLSGLARAAFHSVGASLVTHDFGISHDVSVVAVNTSLLGSAFVTQSTWFARDVE